MTSGPTSYGDTTYRGTYRSDEPESQRIRADIDRTRASMDETFDALDSKLTPGQLLLEGWGLLKGGSGAGASRLMRMAREHPLPTVVIGAGLSWLLLERSRNAGAASRSRTYDRSALYGGGRYDETAGRAYDRTYGRGVHEEYGEGRGRLATAAESVKGVAGEAKDAVTGAVSGAAHKVGHLASEAGDKAGDLAGSVRERASHLGETARERSRRVRTGFWQMLEERPLSVGAATLALGVVAGLSIPSTDKENELMGETRDRLLERAREVGEETLDKGKQVAQKAVETLKDEAERQDLTASGLVEKVHTVAQQTAETVKEEARSQKLTPADLARQAQGRPGPAPVPSGVGEPELVKR